MMWEKKSNLTLDFLPGQGYTSSQVEQPVYSVQIITHHRNSLLRAERSVASTSLMPVNGRVRFPPSSDL